MFLGQIIYNIHSKKNYSKIFNRSLLLWDCGYVEYECIYEIVMIKMKIVRKKKLKLIEFRRGEMIF